MLLFDGIFDKEGVVSLITTHKLVLQEWYHQCLIRIGVTHQSAHCNARVKDVCEKG